MGRKVSKSQPYISLFQAILNFPLYIFNNVTVYHWLLQSIKSVIGWYLGGDRKKSSFK